MITRSAIKRLNNLDYLLFNEKEAECTAQGVPVRNLRYPANLKPLLWMVAKLNARPYLAGISATIFRTALSKNIFSTYNNLDIIHHIGESAQLNGFVALDSSVRLKIPFIAQPTCHPYHYGDKKGDLEICKSASALLLHTNYEKDFFVSKGFKNKMYVVGNGIDKRCDGDPIRFRNKYGIEGEFILYVGRKDQQKGYFLVQESFKKLREMGSLVKLVCMGPCGEGQADRKEGFFDFDFMSEQDKHDALAACTCLCVPSIGESFGLIFLEAGLYRKPVVGRNVPVLSELWEAGQAGILAGDINYATNSCNLDAFGLACNLYDLLLDKEKQVRLGENLHRIAQEYFWEIIIKKFENSYIETISNYKK